MDKKFKIKDLKTFTEKDLKILNPLPVKKQSKYIAKSDAEVLNHMLVNMPKDRGNVR